MTEHDRNFLDHTMSQVLGAVLVGIADNALVRGCGFALLVLGTIGRHYSLRAIRKAQEARTDA